MSHGRVVNHLGFDDGRRCVCVCLSFSMHAGSLWRYSRNSEWWLQMNAFDLIQCFMNIVWYYQSNLGALNQIKVAETELLTSSKSAWDENRFLWCFHHPVWAILQLLAWAMLDTWWICISPWSALLCNPVASSSECVCVCVCVCVCMHANAQSKTRCLQGICWLNYLF